MRYRALDVNGDYTFGQGPANFLVNSPATVAQSVTTRLRLWEGEWFLNKKAGTPWLQKILQNNGKAVADLAIQERILDTLNVTGIENYASVLNPVTRKLTVSMNLQTAFGAIPFSVVL